MRAMQDINELRKLMLDSWEQIERLFPDLRLTLLAQPPGDKHNLRVLRATEAQKKLWPRLEGRICWQYCNKFPKPCLWCPVLRALEHNEIRAAIARSPKPRVTANGEVEFDLSSPEIEYASLGAIPFGKDEDDTRYAIEISVDANRIVRAMARVRESRQKWAVAVAHEIAAQIDREFVRSLIVFGAIAEECLGWTRVSLLFLDEKQGRWPDVQVTGMLCSPEQRPEPEIQRASQFFRPCITGATCDIPVFGNLLADILLPVKLDPPQPLTELMASKGFSPDLLHRTPLDTSLAVRASCSSAIVGVSYGRESLHSILLAESGESTLVSEEDLTDLTMYASFMSQALSTRRTHQANKQARERMDKITGMYGSNGEALALSGGLVIGFAHELRALYTKLSMDAETVLSTGPRGTGWPAFAEEYRANIRSAKAIVDRIMDTSGLAHPRLLSFDLFEETTKLLQEEQSRFAQHGIKGELLNKLEPRGLKVTWDRTMYRLAVSNLLDNAIHWLSGYEAPPRNIEVRLRHSESGGIRIEVLDNGPGIPAVSWDTVFDPFMSLKTREKGMGIGLTVTKRIVEIHGGRIKLFKEGGTFKGACFRIDMPIVAPA